FVSGVLGNTAANGPFSVTVVDPDHFILDGSYGNGVYAGGGTWTILPVDPGLSGGAISFDKDPYNGRDTYSTNIGSTRVGPAHAIASSSIDPTADPGATDAAPIIINSASHGLVTGDRVLISGVAGNAAANGVFNVTVVDPNHFVL